MCRKIGIVPVLWDAGAFSHDNAEKADFCFTIINRETYELIYPELTYGIMRGLYLNYNSLADIVKEPAVAAMTGIGVDCDAIHMCIGEYMTVNATKTPADCNDIILWKTSDDAVATVYNGKIHAKGM